VVIRRRALPSGTFALLLGLATASPLVAQNEIGGRIVDASTNQPIAGAQVSIVGTGQGGLTQPTGRFLILNVQQATVTLEIVMLGYQTWSREVQRGTLDLEIRLEQKALELDAIVVTGTAGAQQARALGNTVGKIDAGSVRQVSPILGLESLIAGGVAGVNVSPGGGEVGTGANIRIRGASSISLSSQPLLYVDGVRVNGFNAGGRNGAGPGVSGLTPPSRLNDINPDDIASIEIIKGPAAATLYGTEASNGVINIITKRGTRGDPRFTLTVRQGSNWMGNPEEYFPSTYYRCQGTGSCTPGEVTEFNVLREDRLRNGNEWFQTGQAQGYMGSVSGGSEKVRYYFSGEWDRDEGIVDYNWQNQLRTRANLNWTPRDDIDVNFGISSVRSNLSSSSANGQPITMAILWSCAFVSCEEGSGAPGAVDGPMRAYGLYLPEVLADSVEGGQKVHRTTYNLTLLHRPTDWFTHRLTAGGDWTDLNTTVLYRPINGPGHFQPGGLKTGLRSTDQFISADYSATATFEPTDEMSFATSAGVQYYQKNSAGLFAGGFNFAAASLETVGAGAVQFADEDFIENKTLGAYLQEQFSWRDQLYLTVAARGDDNSAFGRNFDFVLYPKFSASWVLSEQSFVDQIDWVQELRVRAAWGRAGQQPDVFAAVRTYSPAVGPNASPTLRAANFGNPDLEPEVGEEIELGFDASLFNERLGLQFTYYDSKRTKAIIPVPVKPSLGFPGIVFENIGEIANSGFELGVNAALYRSDGLSLDMNLNMSTNSNEVRSMGGLPPQILNGSNPTTGWAGQYFAEGFPLGAIFLKNVVSADITGSGETAVGTNVMCEGGTVVPDTPNLSRGGGGPVACNQAPSIFQGAPIPTREVSAAWTLALGDNLQLFAQVDYQGGHTMINGTAAGAHLFFRVTRAIHERDDPILLGYESLGPQGLNQAGLIDASFAKLRRVSATWTTPDRVASRIGAEQFTLTLAAHNLWTIWQATEDVFGYPIRDPEQRNTAARNTDPGGLHAYVQDGWPPIKRLMLTARVIF